MAREKALYEGHAVAAVAATSAASPGGAEAHRCEVRSAASRDRRGRGHEAGRAAPARRSLHRRRRAQARQAVQHRQAHRDHPRRRRGRLQEVRCHRGARVQDRAGPSGLHRAARRAGQRLRGRLGRAVVLHAGPLHRARPLRAPAGDGHRQDPRDRLRDRRRLRRQDGRLSRAPGPRALPQGQAAGEDGDVARGGLQGLGPDLGRRREGEDGRDQGRQVRGRLRRAEVSGGRLPGLAGAAGVFCAYAPYDMENVKVIGYDVVSNRPKVAAYRRPGHPSRSSPSRASWTRSPRSSASTRSSCA